MPEGDSIHRLASKLGPVLTGRVVQSFTAHRIPDDAAKSLVGHRIVAVEARGKNLLVRFDDERALLVHLRMHGRVSVERRPRSAFWTGLRNTAPEMRLEVRGAAVVGRHLPVCRLLSMSPSQEKRVPALAQLGPDLLGDTFDEAEALRRFKSQDRHMREREIADVLLDQRIAAGIGNVYKSEILFLEGVHPAVPATSLSDDVVVALYRRARELLLRNVGNGPRKTRPTLGSGRARLWVYGRGGRHCFRCEGPVTRVMSGPDAGRSTYFCERCQERGRPSPQAGGPPEGPETEAPS
jgi:endonuclease VIII